MAADAARFHRATAPSAAATRLSSDGGDEFKLNPVNFEFPISAPAF
jgi:hypothetical protein